MRSFDWMVAKFRPEAVKVTHIVADNVADYAWNHVLRNRKKKLSDFLMGMNLAPPFPQFFVSFRPLGVPNGDVCVEVTAIEDSSGFWILKFEPAASNLGLPTIGIELRVSKETGQADGTLRILTEKGWCLADEWQNMFMILFPALLCVSFMHAKNASIDTVTPPEKLARKQEKKRGVRPLPYRIINIFPGMTQKRNTPSEQSGEVIPKPETIVRGNWATYSGAKLLFGKLSGVFWRPDHVRGNKECGTTRKSYVVHAPEPADV